MISAHDLINYDIEDAVCEMLMHDANTKYCDGLRCSSCHQPIQEGRSGRIDTETNGIFYTFHKKCWFYEVIQ